MGIFVLEFERIITDTVSSHSDRHALAALGLSMLHSLKHWLVVFALARQASHSHVMETAALHRDKFTQRVSASARSSI